MEHEASPILWLIPLLPLVGFLINAFLGQKLTKSPLPLVEAGGHDDHGHHGVPAAPTTDAVMHNVGPSDAPEFADHAGATASGVDAQAAHDDAHDDHSGHGGHDEAHLDKNGTRIVGGLATAMVAGSFVVSLIVFFQLLNGGGHGNGAGAEQARLFSPAFTWMQVPAMAGMPALDLSFRLAVDSLTALMLLIITGIGTLIHLYSTGYMSHDKGYARYFAYLNLFVFFMLLLVMGSNFLVMFVGWEGVGLASYLLIGFWYTRESATDAGKKAFIVNRVGDFAFLIALFFIFKHFGTFEFYGPNGVLTQAGLDNAGASYMTSASVLVPLLMFFGATGKSAQIPLYVWLPDAMEGPTPVSALIHAATMVTAGVYMVCRAHLLFLQAPGVMMFMAIIGLATAIMAATIGLVQNDIKKVLAYSTVSQLGYMFLACGVGAFGIAMFHVMTHAFFKALLFLGSGSVIHAMSGEQDMRKMGGLGAKIRMTYLTMFIGTLAISGIPLLAGFFSKDEILLNAFAGPSMNGLGHPLLWFGGWIVAGMTAFYMWRMMGKTFMGQPRYSEEVGRHIHESPASMTFPLQALAVLSILGGFLNPGALAALGLHVPHYLEHFLGSTVAWREEAGRPLNVPHLTEVLLVASSVAMAVGMSLFAWNAYKRAKNGERLTETQKRQSPVWNSLYNKYGVDERYNDIFVAGGKRMSNWLWRFIDVRVIDATVNGVAGAIGGLGQSLRGWQSGYVRNYALSMLLGALLIVIGCLIAFSSGAFAR